MSRLRVHGFAMSLDGFSAGPELADSSAATRGDAFIGAEHLLLGLVAERTGPAAQILAHLGVTADRVRRLLAEARPRG